MEYLYRTRIQRLTGCLVVQKRIWGQSDLIPQTEGVHPWMDCTKEDIATITNKLDLQSTPPRGRNFTDVEILDLVRKMKPTAEELRAAQ